MAATGRSDRKPCCTSRHGSRTSTVSSIDQNLQAMARNTVLCNTCVSRRFRLGCADSAACIKDQRFDIQVSMANPTPGSVTNRAAIDERAQAVFELSRSPARLSNRITFTFSQLHSIPSSLLAENVSRIFQVPVSCYLDCFRRV